MFSRLELLIGDKINNLHNAKVIVFGIGGVGGYAVEMLARSGVGSISLVDYDTVSVSNKNRQIIATDFTVGKSKVEVMKERILSYYPECNVTCHATQITRDNIVDFNLSEYDYILDAIDMVDSKVALIQLAHECKTNIISAMGAGNRIGVPSVKVVDIYSTHDDGLAKVMRKKLRDLGITSHKVVFCENNTIKSGAEVVGSMACFPAISGCVMAAQVIEDLLK